MSFFYKKGNRKKLSQWPDLEGLVLLLGVVHFGQLLLALPGNLVLDLIQVLPLVLLVRIFQSICVLFKGLVNRSGLEIGHFEKKIKVKKTQLKKKLNNSRKKLKVLANF